MSCRMSRRWEIPAMSDLFTTTARPDHHAASAIAALLGGAAPIKRLARPHDREHLRAAAGQVRARCDHRTLRARSGRRDHGTQQTACADVRWPAESREELAAHLAGRGCGVHGRHQARAGILRRRRHRPLIPREPRGAEPAAARSLPARARLARRSCDPGPRSHAPHAPGVDAAVPAGDDRLQG